MPSHLVRPAIPSDLPAIAEILRRAFPTELEARLVATLVSHCQDVISLVAAAHDDIVGHVLFTPATCDGLTSHSEGLGLAPLAVLPEFQKRGIGTALVHAGLDECRRLKMPWAVVLGEPAYYSRFGFEPGIRYGLTCEFGGEDAFQIIRLTGEIPGSGLVRYAAEFRMVLGP